jgi:hypothetical protein
MAKKNCDFETQVVNGGQMGLAMFIVGMGASVLRRLKGKGPSAAEKRARAAARKKAQEAKK